MVADVVLAVIRAELPLSTLEEVGVHVTFGENCCEVSSETPIIVTPSASDIARGLLALQEERDELRRWAFFLLADLEVVDFEKLNSDPKGDLLKGALWDASFSGKVDKKAIKVAESVL